ncbi:GTPase [Desulfoferrobacter suflitae]|uniref:GTPase n=1 Tax=Desulfoferrobacter suflitae TaxID=2865782 RepID=UPI002164EE7B|nr:GTPase [Desulfoferrobacter suflitae]MCK8600611.1 50S ribosome-binding GTPase [Desulfoferrobacter suflitae]
MKHSVLELRNDLTQFQALLGDGSFFTFSAKERDDLLAQSEKYLHKLDGLAEGFLTIGLLGGTGVGKSSIMNALAGSEISSTSHRRPHTNQVLIYHHEASFLPANLQQAAVPWRSIKHQADSIRQILLCDLPDFDSLSTLHREHVNTFLEHLDVLVWITSPEKYADERFYQFLRHVPKAKQNFYFVLNKADLLFEGQPKEEGYDRLSRVTENFQRYLIENEVSHPLIYALSAGQILGNHPVAPWNQFGSFRRQIFQHRDVKEIMAIKAANIDVEVQQLLSVLDKEAMNIAAARQVLEKFIQDVQHGRADWAAIGGQALDVWLAGHLRKDIYFWTDFSGILVGPGRVLLSLLRDWRRWIEKEPQRSVTQLLIEGRTAEMLQRRLERLQDRVAHGLLSRGLPPMFQQQVESILDPASQWDELKERLDRAAEMWLARTRAPAAVGFRSIQYLTYGFVLLLMLLALAGESAWRSFLENPGWSGLVIVLSALVQHLFSPVGLAALGSYILLNVFFAFRFYARYKKLLQRHAQKFIESLKSELIRVWEAELDSIIEQMQDYDRELEARMAAIGVLHERKSED